MMIFKVFQQEVKKIHKKKSFLLLLGLILVMTIVTVFVYRDLIRIATTGASGIERLSPFMIKLLPNMSNVEFSKRILCELLVKTPLPIGMMLLLVVVFEIYGNEKKKKIIENMSFYTHDENSIFIGKGLATAYLVCFVLLFQLIASFVLSIPLMGLTLDGFGELIKLYLSLALPFVSILFFAGGLSLIISNNAILYLIGFVGIIVLSIISPRLGTIHLLPTNIFALMNQGDSVNILRRDNITINVVSGVLIFLTVICIKIYLGFVRKKG